MKIKEINAENYGPISFLKMSPSGVIIEVCGSNGKGKTRILKGANVVLLGDADGNGDVVTHGEGEAMYQVKLQDEVKEDRPMRFTDNGNGTITDHKTGLMWEQATRGRMPHAAAIASCEALTLAGHADWRLPTIHELLTIVDYARYRPACDPLFDARSYDYWSSSTCQGGPTSAWGVDFYDRDTVGISKTGSSYVRGVRAGS